jgi:protoporphyrin/coproporphyrin ferrochelatase
MTWTDHISVLTCVQEEIDMEYRELAEKSGIVHWRRVPALNTDERFIADMADMVVRTANK